MGDNQDKCLVVFTDSYPYPLASENTFLDPELPCLTEVFKSVTLVPKSCNADVKPVPTEIIIDESLSGILKKTGKLFLFRGFLLCFTSRLFYEELLLKPRIALHPKAVLRNLVFLSKAYKIKDWLQDCIIQERFDVKNCVFYTYWLNEVTLGIRLLKSEFPDMVIISRAHGADLYEERHNPPYIPYQTKTFESVTKIYADSAQGMKYLQQKFPEYHSLFSISRLGVPRQNFITQVSDDKIFRIVSCSFLVPVKRIELLIHGLSRLGSIQNTRKIEWIHIGKGPLFQQLNELAETTLTENISWKFLGFVPEGGVINYYKNNPVDIFINVSASEGTPVTIMEAQSCGIPVMATSVGGNTEIVTEENGFLLNRDPTPEEIAVRISGIMNNVSELKDKKALSKENWNKNYNSDKNYEIFAHELAGYLKKV